MLDKYPVFNNLVLCLIINFLLQVFFSSLLFFSTIVLIYHKNDSIFKSFQNIFNPGNIVWKNEILLLAIMFYSYSIVPTYILSYFGFTNLTLANKFLSTLPLFLLLSFFMFRKYLFTKVKPSNLFSGLICLILCITLLILYNAYEENFAETLKSPLIVLFLYSILRYLLISSKHNYGSVKSVIYTFFIFSVISLLNVVSLL